MNANRHRSTRCAVTHLAMTWTIATATNVSAEPVLPALVVMPVQVSGFRPPDDHILDDLLADAVRNTGKYSVIGTSDVDAMLKLEYLRDRTGCSDVDCAAEIGGALGVRYLLSSRVAKLGDRTVVVLKLIDTKSRSVLNSIIHKAVHDTSAYDDELVAAVQKLIGAKYGHRPTGAVGEVRVVAKPNGRIFVDGVNTGLATPAVLRNVPVGPRKVQVRSAGLVGEATVDVLENQRIGASVTVNAPQEGTGNLRVDADVPGTLVSVDGSNAGIVPALIERMKVGAHRVVLSPPDANHFHFVTDVRVSPNETTSISYQLSARPQHRVALSMHSRTFAYECQSTGDLNRDPPGIVSRSSSSYGDCNPSGQGHVAILYGPEIAYEWLHHPNWPLRIGASPLTVWKPGRTQNARKALVGSIRRDAYAFNVRQSYRVGLYPRERTEADVIELDFAAGGQGIVFGEMRRIGAVLSAGIRLWWVYAELRASYDTTVSERRQALELCRSDSSCEREWVRLTTASLSYGGNVGLVFDF